MPCDPVIGLVIATMLEAEPFIDELVLVECETDPFSVYCKDCVYLIISGIGKANAAMASTHLIQHYHPAFICNAGAAGSVSALYRLGECYHIAKVIEPDRPELKTGIYHTHIPDVIDGLPTAVLATQDKPVRDSAERERIALEAQLVDMEGASVVQACKRFRTKCYLFKFVSDTPDHGTSNDIVKNITFHRNAFFHLFHDTVLARIIDTSSTQ
jgi:adenosylhomocysteine nucleosidase